MERIVASAVLALAGCGGSEIDEGDGFAPGKWQLEASLEPVNGPGGGQSGGNQTDAVDLTAKQAQEPPATVFFSQFYQGERDWRNVTFRDGKVSGSLDHGKATVPVSGTYASDHFRVTLRYTGLGTSADHVIEGRLVEPAR